MKFRRGFTLLETMIVLAIVGVLAGLAITSFSAYSVSKSLEGAASRAAGAFDQARLRTLAGKDGYAYGVRLTASSATIFRGSSFDPATSTNEVITFDPRIEIADIALSGGGSDVVFARLSGAPSAVGTFAVRHAADHTRVRTITINSAGVVSIE